MGARHAPLLVGAEYRVSINRYVDMAAARPCTRFALPADHHVPEIHSGLLGRFHEQCFLVRDYYLYYSIIYLGVFAAITKFAGRFYLAIGRAKQGRAIAERDVDSPHIECSE